jgi:hypothetical protein
MRWRKIIAAMIRNQTPFDAAIHTQNQLQHGSCVMQLQSVQIMKGAATASGRSARAVKAFLAIGLTGSRNIWFR